MIDEPVSAVRFHRLLLTGAAGHLGGVLRPRLRRYCDRLRLSHLEAIDDAGEGEEVAVADLADAAAVEQAVAGVDAIVHLGGVATDQPWAPILAGNIVGLYNLYEAARKHRVKRVVFASSNHVTGFYRQDEVVSPRDPQRPDSLYGLSKAFGENVAQFYWDRWRVETVSLRIGSSFDEPVDRRMLATWLSYDDLERLVVSSLTAPIVGHTVIYGMSDNRTTWWDNTPARHIGYRPLDSSERFRAAVEARQQTIAIDDPVAIHQGGGFVVGGPHG